MGLLFALFRILPARLGRLVLGSLGVLVYLAGIRRRIALDNLAIAFPEMTDAERRRIARANYRHLGESAADFLRSPSMSDEELMALVEPVGYEVVDRLLAGPLGFVAATAHMGNFELFGVWGARRKVPLTLLTRPLKGSANANWVNNRALAGIKEIHKGMQNLLDSVNHREALGILIDQNMLPKRAVFVPFFGRPAATTPAPAVVSQRTGCQVLLALVLRKPDGRYRTHFEGPFRFERTSADLQEDIRAFTLMLNQRFERIVREHPEQWFWLHRRWKTRPPDESPGA